MHAPATSAAPSAARDTVQRARIHVRGTVQGVGFRPFVYRLATELGLAGSVWNAVTGVHIDAEGPRERLDTLLTGLKTQCPDLAQVESLDVAWDAAQGYRGFAIAPTPAGGAAATELVPDVATCPDCLREVFDPANRRYRYPFTNCTHCGPRLSIVLRLPYDRPNTTMAGFPLCAHCRGEYESPADRRFHAQPNACPVCGPRLAFWDARGHVLSRDDDALLCAADAIRNGQIVAVKGLGGFHLLVDARDEAAVARLRQRKHREQKPFAVMFPSLAAVQTACVVTEVEQSALTSPESPIVLLRARDAHGFARGVAPGLDTLGAMVPYTPLHHLLLRELGFPVVATSGNRSDEPICTNEHEALDRLTGIADAFLVHNRPIARPVDDSVVRAAAGRVLVLRRARGMAPRSIGLPFDGPSVLAVGGHLKTTIAVTKGNRVYLSPHIGDLDSPEACDAHRRAVGEVNALFAAEPRLAVADIHPDYASRRTVQHFGLPARLVQHHYAHVLAAMAEHGLDGPVLGVSWDGSGYGPDGTVWGGEFLIAGYDGFTRAAHLRPFRLPGGEAAVKEPRRSALGVLYELHGVYCAGLTNLAPIRAFSSGERRLLCAALARGTASPITTSAGRLFDAVAALVGVQQISGYEGQAATMLEAAAAGTENTAPYPYRLVRADCGLVVDWAPIVRALCDDTTQAIAPATASARFHETLAAAVADVASQLDGPRTVVLTGGCFQNALLLERSAARLGRAGFRVYWPQQFPPNDGGLALGQAVCGMRAGAIPQNQELDPCV